MSVDTRRACALQRMYHGPGEDDFTWGRWYWNQDAAEDLPIDTQYGNNVWHQEPGVFFGSGGFRLTPGPLLPKDVRANGNYMEKGDVYARSVVSPFPGVEYHGRDEWYLAGLPISERIDLPAGPMCGADAWDSTVGINVTLSTHEEDDQAGGLVIGGAE